MKTFMIKFLLFYLILLNFNNSYAVKGQVCKKPLIDPNLSRQIKATRDVLENNETIRLLLALENHFAKGNFSSDWDENTKDKLVSCIAVILESLSDCDNLSFFVHLTMEGTLVIAKKEEFGRGGFKSAHAGIAILKDGNIEDIAYIDYFNTNEEMKKKYAEKLEKIKKLGKSGNLGNYFIEPYHSVDQKNGKTVFYQKRYLGNLAKTKLNKKEKKEILNEVTKAIKLLHKEKWVHLDLKESNIFLEIGIDGKYHPIIADLDGATSVDTLNEIIATNEYVNPKFVKKIKMGKKITPKDLYDDDLFAIKVMRKNLTKN